MRQTPAMEEQIQSAFPIVITGHVDHGKSTLVGRLLYDTGTLQSERYQEMVQSSCETGREDEFAFVLDAFEEERRRGITIDTSQIYFSSKLRPYVIIDTPGHREFIRNMVTGACYAKAAVLLLDATEGVQEQTRRHAWLLGIVGIKDVCVAVNKMDAVGYSEDRFQDLREAAQALLREFGIAAVAVIPISARLGDNIAQPSPNMPWCKVPTLMDLLDSLQSSPIEEGPFRFPVQDVYRMAGERILVGRVESGTVHPGEKVQLLPQGLEATVEKIRTFPAGTAGSASYGEAVGLTLSGSDYAEPVRGTVLAHGELPGYGTSFSATIFWFFGDYSDGDAVTIRCATQAVPATIALGQVFDPAQPEVELAGDMICVGEAAHCTIRTQRHLVCDDPSRLPETGRFVVERDGIPAGAGIFR